MIRRDRKLGLPLATALVANNMIGSGIFLLPATLASFGSVTLVAWGIAAAGALLIAAVFGRLGQTSPLAGGFSACVDRAFGPFVGFQTSTLYWTSCVVGNVAIAVAAIGYLAALIPALAAPWPAALGAAAAIWLFTLANAVGPRFACQFTFASLAFGLGPVLVVATAGWLEFDPAIFRESWNVRGEPAASIVPASLVLVFWAFLGLEGASVATAVVENPRRNVPLATVGGVLLAATIYMASCAAIMGLLPAQSLARSTAPFADATRVVLGPVAAGLIALMALTKALGTLTGLILTTSQLGRAAAERGFLPSLFGRLDGSGIPVRGLLVLAALMSAISLATVSPTLGQQFARLIEVSVIFTLIPYAFACAAVWRFGAARESPASRRLWRALAVAAMAFCAGVILMSGMRLIAIGLLAAGLTGLLFWAFVRRSAAPLRASA